MDDASYSYFLQWHVTEKCNQRCRHCYQHSPADEMTCQEICQASDKIAETIQSWAYQYEIEVSPSIHFTGGEPFLREDVFDVLHHVRRRGFRTALMSNGTLVTADIAVKIKEAGVEDVQVSFDGMKSVHDSIRGEGAFEKAVAGCQNLVAEGIDLNLNMTLSSLNYQELEPVVQLAGELGASAVSFSRLVPCGRGKNLNKYSLSSEQLSGLGDILAGPGNENGVALISRDPVIAPTDTYNHADIGKLNFPIGGCAAGIFGVTIAADGTIMPCRRMDLSIGNIKRDDFRQIWVESPVLISLRNRENYHGNCRTCCYWAVCRGCRAIALASARSSGNDDFLGPDPQCTRYKPAN